MTAAVDLSAATETSPKGINYQIKETRITPIGVQAIKQDTPEGTIIYLKMVEGLLVAPGMMIPASITIYKLGEEEAQGLVDLLHNVLSGIHLAKASELPR